MAGIETKGIEWTRATAPRPKQIESTQEADDLGLLERADEIMALLQRAMKLGYSLVLGPDQMRELVRLLEDAGLERKRKD